MFVYSVEWCQGTEIVEDVICTKRFRHFWKIWKKMFWLFVLQFHKKNFPKDFKYFIKQTLLVRTLIHLAPSSCIMFVRTISVMNTDSLTALLFMRSTKWLNNTMSQFHTIWLYGTFDFISSALRMAFGISCKNRLSSFCMLEYFKCDNHIKFSVSNSMILTFQIDDDLTKMLVCSTIHVEVWR